MSTDIDFDQIKLCELMQGDSDDETTELHSMLDQAENYLRSFAWCPEIIEKFVGVGVPGVVALFLFKLKTSDRFTDEWLWVAEGDIPSAYFVIDDASDPISAVTVYCELMDEWATAVESDSDLSDVFPVASPATKENAMMLRRRTKFLRERIVPNLS